MEKIRCEWCHKRIVKARKGHRFCSAKCRYAAWDVDHPRTKLEEEDEDAQVQKDR
jgi:endogenous inhibitor of DNA gyrase (YacG/DUF329 family)